MAGFLALLQALPAFFQALPYLFQVTLKFMNFVERVLNWAKANKVEKWIDELEQTFDQIENAKTPDEKQAAARELSRLIRTLK